ncbi:MAG: response regulator [Bacillaceae bacterium]|nr:response regulator [Bacillaceae bacterium]
MNLLIVDDEPFVLEQLKYMIQERYPHWNIYAVMDGSQALDALKHHEIHLAFLDIELPGKSGLELAQMMKDQTPYTTVIILSAHQDFEYARQSIQIGVADYLTKPIIEEELLDILEKYANEMDHSDLVMRAIQFIQSHYHEKINLTQLANELFVNPSYLSRKFHEEVGVPFSEYLLNYRIDMAKEKLSKNKGESISVIAEKCGFGSLHYFSYAFKKKTGCTPKKYKQEGQKHAQQN